MFVMVVSVGVADDIDSVDWTVVAVADVGVGG